MSTSPLDLTPPDNTGTDTLIRYRYQAQLIVPFCLECAANGTIVSVLAEHFEDIAIEFCDKWHFVQVKTRNQNLGPWKISDAVDGLKSLWRTYKYISPYKTIKASYALFLEGAIAKDDPLNDLAPLELGSSASSGELNPSLIDKVMKELKIAKPDDCKNFLAVVSVQANQPTRQDVTARNLYMLSKMAVGAPFREVESGYDRLVNRILKAMADERFGDELPSFIVNPDAADISSKAANKRLTRSAIRDQLGSLVYGPSLLLKRLVEPNVLRPTNLEMKLLAAGAENKTIEDAKMLRANATMRESELLAASYDDYQLKDVRNRLSVVANSVILKHVEDAKPALKAYNELLMTLMEKAASCDPNRIFRQDPYFLLGEVCALADECIIDWGVPLA